MAEIEKTKAEVSEKKSDKKPKSDKPSFIERAKKFLREYKAELGKVTWASREDTMKNFVVVAVTVVIAGAVVGVLDIAFSEGIRALGRLI